MIEPKSEEWRRMLAGELYDATDAALTEARAQSERLCQRLNRADPGEKEQLRAILTELLGSFGKKAEIRPPFYCDYGVHIEFGDGSFMNFNGVILDVAAITIGDRVQIGPAVQIYAATHPLEASVRATGKESGLPVRIEDDVWIGGGAIICPGVTIGEGTTIGAGSVVTRSIPAHVFAAGNPCRVIRELVPDPA